MNPRSAVAFLGLVAAIAVQTVTPSQAHLTILAYHRFGDSRYPSTNISEEKFREELEYLRQEEYEVLSRQEVGQYLRDGQGFPEKAVWITIDDGYRSVYRVAFPLLREYGFPFTVFLYSHSIQQHYSDMLTLEQIREMRDAGVTFGNHTATHPHLGVPAENMTEHEYRTWVAQEIRECQQFLQHHDLEGPAVAFPWGEYNPIVIEESRRLGYELLLSQDAGTCLVPLDRQEVLPRQAIAGTNMSLDRFRAKLEAPPLELTHLVPAPGFLASETPSEFSAQIANPERYRPGIINMFVSELGRVESTFEPETGRIIATNTQLLSRSYNRVTITAKLKDENRFARRSWMIYAPPPWEQK